MPKLVWRVKLVAELEPGVTTQTEVACLERGEEAGLADLGLRLDEAKQLTAALQAEMVSAQLAVVGERRRWCMACGRPLASKGHYRATFRSLFGDVPVRVRRLLVCPCRGPGEPKGSVRSRAKPRDRHKMVWHLAANSYNRWYPDSSLARDLTEPTGSHLSATS